MCLDTVTKRIKPTKRVRVGWKIFFKCQDGELQLLYRNLEGDSIIKRGEWLKAEEQTIYFGLRDRYYTSGFYDMYTSGFHAYKSIPQVYPPSCIAVKVKLRGVHTIGFEEDKEVLVAQEMFVEEE